MLSCSKFKPVREIFPKGDRKTLNFTKYEYQLPVPFIVVGDIETLLVPESTASHDLSKSGTTTINHHQPCSAGYAIISTDPKYAKKFKPKLFRGKHCVRYFLDSLQQDYLELKEIVDRPLEMIMSPEERQEYDNSSKCWICEKEIVEGEVKVADHCHVTAAFRGAAHRDCNLNYRLKPSQFKLPIFFHNLKGYDAHFLIKEVDPNIHGPVSAIPQSSEKYISFRVGNLIFKDSLSFLLMSLEEVASKLSLEDLVYTRRFFEKQVLTNEIPFIDANTPPVSLSNSQPVQSEDNVNDDVVVDELSGKRKASSSCSRPVPKRQRSIK